LANGRLRGLYLANGLVAYDHEGGEEREPGLHAAFNDPFYPRFWEDRMYTANKELKSAKKPRGIFPCDMGELFGDWVPYQWQAQIFQVFHDNPQHRFYLLTKQPQNLAKFSPFPDNCYVGVSITTFDMARSALPYLAQLDARVKFVSYEPLLEMVPCGHTVELVDWIILGGLSGKQPFYPPEAWIEEIELAAGRAGGKDFEKQNLYKDSHRRALRQEMP